MYLLRANIWAKIEVGTIGKANLFFSFRTFGPDLNSPVTRLRLAMPNILITGTPGTGKTTLAQAIVAAHPEMRHIELSKLIAEQELHEGRDEHFDTLIMDDDKVVDYLEDVMDIHKHRNTIVDFHTSDFFPERWFDLVIVLRTSAAPHYDRLQAKYACHYIP